MTQQASGNRINKKDESIGHSSFDFSRSELPSLLQFPAHELFAFLETLTFSLTLSLSLS